MRIRVELDTDAATFPSVPTSLSKRTIRDLLEGPLDALVDLRLVGAALRVGNLDPKLEWEGLRACTRR